MMHRKRGGFSLMEVLLSTSILLGSSVVLIELANIGRKQANLAYDLNRAQLFCQAKLDEIVVGISPTTSVEDEELEDEPGWYYSVENLPIRRQNLIAIKVSVFQEPEEEKRPVQFSLVRWLPDTSSTSSDLAPKPNETATPSNASTREPSSASSREARP